MRTSLALCTAGLLAAATVAAGGPFDAASKAFAQAAGQETVLASAAFRDDPELQLDLLELKRVSGGALLMRWRVTNTSGGEGGLVQDEGKKFTYNVYGPPYEHWSGFYFIDPTENKKYHVLQDSEGNRIAGVYSGYYEPGDQRLNWAKFPAPPPSSKRISVHMLRFQPIEDVPISD